MSDTPTLATRAGGMIAAMGIRGLMSTLNYRVMYYDQKVDPKYPSPTPRIYVFWHENILIPLYMRGNCNLSMLLSKHRDADILDRVAYHLGFECVRGSTFRGATSALRELARRGKNMHLTITPDGPRGPRRQLAQGAVFLASRLQLPIVALGFGCNRPWRVNSWDRFAVPKPFSRARAVISPEIHIPPGINREEIELKRQGVEQLLNQLTCEAEQWAESGAYREGSFSAVREGLRAEPAGPQAAGQGFEQAWGVVVPQERREQRAAG